MLPRHSLLVVDDDAMVRHFMCEGGERAGFAATGVGSLEEVQQVLEQGSPDLIVLDLNLGSTDGIEVLEFLARAGCSAPVIPVSGYDARVLRTAARIGTDLGLAMMEPVEKPFTITAFREALAAVPLSSLPLSDRELEGAMDRGELSLRYQPKVRLSDGLVVGVEALARWTHPERGPVPPGEFIGLAEESGLIHTLTLRAFRRAVKAAAGWSAAGDALPVGLNVSALSLDDLELPEQLARICAEERLDPSLVTLEITESMAMTDTDAATRLLTRLRLRGFQLSLDDFGTGFSSLVELHRMPFSELKIDQSFVTDLDRDADAATITRAIIDLSHALGLTVVAEGIERADVSQRLLAMGCDTGQGFWFSRSMAADEVGSRLREGSWRLGCATEPCGEAG